ncbi:DUF4432 family protein [Amycolatopsis sp.]|uniref:DUF4432 family protein n=1 Tax=Amycolatopsis sp. TaxID=37632 RepID=UPI002C5F2241|nr:DUF4432 family protein [Amycolatopsis sp.]HVV11185.1 DUF4432 family protein [Amycolatopsis sp.]
MMGQEVTVRGHLPGCEVRESVLTNGPATGARQVEMRVEGGIDLRISPDRGFDIAQAWWRGVPIAWSDPSREALPTPNVSGVEWLRSFAGGLLTTCGLRHVGQPRNGHGLHGRFSHQRAEVLGRWETSLDGVPAVAATARISEPGSFGCLLELERTVSTRAGTGAVEVRDVVTNSGEVREPLELLYHFNFPFRNGRPPEVLLDGEMVTDDLGGVEETIELEIQKNSTIAIELRTPASGTVLELSWESTVLRYLHIWVYPGASNRGVLAVEPSTVPMLKAHANEDSSLHLKPGDRTEIALTLRAHEQ